MLMKFPTTKMRISKCFMMMAILEEEEELKRMELLALIAIRDSCRIKNYLTSSCLHSQGETAWNRFYYFEHDNFLAVTGLSRRVFELVLTEFNKHYCVLSGPGRVGRPPRLGENNAVLGKSCLAHPSTARRVERYHYCS